MRRIEKPTWDRVYSVIQKGISGYDANAWEVYLSMINPPAELKGIIHVADRLLAVCNHLKPPIIDETSLRAVALMEAISNEIIANDFVLKKTFGDVVIQRPTGAKSNPLYYLLFHSSKPEIKDEYIFLLAWLFLTFNNPNKPRAIPKTTKYDGTLAARSISDELSEGNILDGINTSVTQKADFIKQLRAIKNNKEIALQGSNTKKRIHNLIVLLESDARPRDIGQRTHSEHERTYFLPTPRRGYVPLSAQLVNRNKRSLEMPEWAPSEIWAGDIRDEQLIREFDGGEEVASESKTGLLPIEIRTTGQCPELTRYKMEAATNALARSNQVIPFKLSSAPYADLATYYRAITTDHLDLNLSILLQINLLTGIAIRDLVRISVLSDLDAEQPDDRILYCPAESEIYFPIRQARRKKNESVDAPTHFPLELPEILAALMTRLPRDRAFLFEHRSIYYENRKKDVIDLVNKRLGTILSPEKIDRFHSDIALTLGHDAIAISQLCQRDFPFGTPQNHYTAFNVRHLNQVFQSVVDRILNILGEPG